MLVIFNFYQEKMYAFSIVGGKELMIRKSTIIIGIRWLKGETRRSDPN